MGENILAIDVGTQSVRAAVVGADGEIAGVAQVAHEVDSPQASWAQQRPGDWWAETCRATNQVLGDVQLAARLAQPGDHQNQAHQIPGNLLTAQGNDVFEEQRQVELAKDLQSQPGSAESAAILDAHALGVDLNPLRFARGVEQIRLVALAAFGRRLDPSPSGRLRLTEIRHDPLPGPARRPY